MSEWQKLGLTTISWQDLRLLKAQAMDDLRRSMVETGFAVITDVKISAAGAYAVWTEFFRSSGKAEFATKDGQTGYFPLRSENAAGRSEKDLKEFVHLFPHGPQGELSRRLLDDESTSLVIDQAENLSSLVLSVLEQYGSIHHTASDWDKSVARSPSSLLRILRYPPVTDAKPGEVRAAEHTDINMITVLPVATAPGLQVKTLDGRWIDVPYVPGSVVVNVGEMLEVASGGYYRATPHRVVTPPGEEANERYSMPFFAHPHPDYELRPGLTARAALQKRLVELGLIKE